MKLNQLAVMLSCVLVANVMADPVFPIDPQQYGMQKPFGPPKPITPKDVLTARPENQFDLSQRNDYSSVIESIDGRMDKPFHLTVGQYDNSTYTGALWRQREANYYVIGSLAYTHADDYKDGDGNTVNYGYNRKNAALVLGILPTMTTEHRLTLVYDDIDDDKQPQHVMDPVNTRRVVGKYNGRFGAQDDSNTLHLELSAIDLKRQANNFDLRTNPASMPKVAMDVKRQQYLADIHYNFKFDDQNRSSIGLRYKDDSHDAKRFVMTPMGKRQNGYRFPAVKTKTTSLYASHEWQPTQQHSLKGALDYTWQTAEARAVNSILNLPPAFNTSQKIWSMYGYDGTGKIKQDGLSGKLRYEFKPEDGQQFYGELVSLYRMPENPERFAVLFAPPVTGMGWGTNPRIKPERENRLTLGMKLNGEGWGDYQSTLQDDYAGAWQIKGEVYYADVDNFITLDRYRGPVPLLRGNVISRNVDAKLAGINVGYQQNWTQNLSSLLGVSYRYGKNKTDNRPLYQIAPLEANLSVDWKDYFDGGSYNIGSRLRHQHKQNRRDDNRLTGLGIDNETSGFTTLDIYGGIEWKNNIGISLGVDNVFDKKYAEYITGGHVESVAPSVVNAPGRTFWLRLNAAF
ncbi:MAG: TonB-dependent receptor [Gammaproteobacteria bacterium]|nr:MAG: TonB-dependent receptor [Gammaproteobacteria bacterium]